MKNQFISTIFLGCLTVQVAIGELLYFSWKTEKNGLVNISHGMAQKVGLQTIDKQAILDMTNALRYKIATGQESGTPAGLAPNATNMLAVEWDDDLAVFAQKWADKCKPFTHSDSKITLPDFKNASVSENLSGGPVRIDRNMYGEVRGWTYVTQHCSIKECGHYNTLVSWANYRLGCGFKICYDWKRTPSTKPTDVISLVCEFAPYRSAGLMPMGSTRPKYMYEYWTNLKPGVSYDPSQPASIMYAKSEPCSECPQGWDYCIKGGLCATKRQCDSDPGNGCVCNIKESECQANGGTFDSANCKCKCPSNKYGRNCANNCENQPGAIICGMDCGRSNMELWLCHKACGSCGKSVSAPYKYWYEDRPTKDANRLKVRVTPPTPNPPIPKNVVTAHLSDRGHCTNKEKDYFCENIRRRHYCTDAYTGAKWRHFCEASCNSCGNKDWMNEIKADMKKKGINPNVPAVVGPAEDSGWSTTGSTSDSGTGSSSPSTGGGWAPSPSTGGGWAPSPSSGGGWSPSGSSAASAWKSKAISDSGWGTVNAAVAPGSNPGDAGWTNTSPGTGWTPSSPGSGGTPSSDASGGWAPSSPGGGWSK